jgi:phosphoribosylaminoimidazole carboxylase PurE protein
MNSKTSSKVAVIMGSTSDSETMQSCLDVLKYFEIPFDVHTISAHRNPDQLISFSQEAEANGFKVIIAGAGMAAHLPGVIASRTILPVIGIPLDSSSLGGQDALFSIVQMPPGVPVATVSIGKAGAKNSAVLAAEILALQDSELKKKLLSFKNSGCKIK